MKKPPLIVLFLITFLWACSKKSDTVVIPQSSQASDTSNPAPVSAPTQATPETPQGYVILNKGIPGNTSTMLLDRVDTDVIALKPQLAIVLIGTNDVSHHITWQTYQSNLITLVNKMQAAKINIILVSPPPRGKTYISPTDFLNNRIDTLTNVMAQVAKQYNCYFFNLNSALKSVGTPNPTASSLINNPLSNPQNPDGIHLTLNGNIFLALDLFHFILVNNLKDNHKIICFGDSITYEGGSGSYPNQLISFLKSRS